MVGLAIGLVLGSSGDAHAQNRPSFRGVGDLAGGAVHSVAEAVADDGSVVVGGSESAAGPQAFRWTQAGGIVGLGDLSGGVFNSHASSVSANGSVIAGSGVTSGDEGRAFRWTSGGGLVALGAFFCSLCPPHAFGNGISANGLVVVGSGAQKPLFGSSSVNAARWPSGGTSISDLGHLPGGGQASEAQAASSTGSLIVGSSDASAGVRAFRWSSGGGMVALPDVPGAQVNAGATDVSDAGTVIVGFANTHPTNTSRQEAMRWVGPSYSPAQLLGALPGASFPGSIALGVSADGTLIVGSAKDEDGDDAAFLWDATNGMRKLSLLLEQEYGLDLTGWTLVDARGISAVNAAGEFWIVGDGINPSGSREGWVALLSAPACNDGLDNDSDGQTDFPADPQCTAKGDRSETPDCGDGLDNDGDGPIDFPVDPQCTAAADQTERADCGDGIDNDGDGAADHPADAGCRTATGLLENPACQNGIDDESDGKTDFPADRDCVAADDRSEIFDCNDGLDNDGDTFFDFPADSDCTGPFDAAEDPQCADRLDNDLDGQSDYPLVYPACQSASDTSERAACSDGTDNDGDGQIDFPADTGCVNATFGSEAPVALALGDLLVLDRRSRSLFRLNPASGAQTAISTGAQLGDPQGLAIRASGAVVVADPVGLLEIGPAIGSQRRFSSPLVDGVSLQLVFDGAGNAVVLEQSRLSTTQFRYGELSTPVALLSLPVSGSIGVFQGDALAREASGSLLVCGFGLLGDGIYRVSADGSSTSKVTPGFSGDAWNDLAVEASGTILAAGRRNGTPPGVVRVNPTTGAVTALSTSGWTSPSAVAVGLAGRIFVADAGACTTSGCTGAKVVELHPTSGAQISVATGGSITGETDLAVVTVLPACGNGVDDDGDGATDFPGDAQCAASHDPSEALDCANGIDDDGDGLIDDPADPGCLDASASSRENPACDDNLDNDGDGAIDSDGGPGGGPIDPQCTQPYFALESPPPTAACGLGAELGVVLPVLLAFAKRRRRNARSS